NQADNQNTDKVPDRLEKEKETPPPPSKQNPRKVAPPPLKVKDQPKEEGSKKKEEAAKGGKDEGGGKKEKKKKKHSQGSDKGKEKPIKKEPDESGQEKEPPGPGPESPEKEEVPEFLPQEAEITDDYTLPYNWQLPEDQLAKLRDRARIRIQKGGEYFDPPTAETGQASSGQVVQEDTSEPMAVTAPTTGPAAQYASGEDQAKLDANLFERLTNICYGSVIVPLYYTYKDRKGIFGYKEAANDLAHKTRHTSLVLTIGDREDLRGWISELERWTTETSYTTDRMYESAEVRQAAGLRQLKEFADGTLLLYLALIEPRPRAEWDNTPLTFNLDKTPILTQRDPELHTLTVLGGIQHERWLKNVEKGMRDDIEDMKAQEDLNSDRMTGEPHPIFTTELFTEWKKSDPLGLASSLEVTDYIPIIEYLKTETWAFNRVTRNPQYKRYRVFSAPSTNNVEKESLFNMVMRKDVDKKKYEKLRERKERPEDKGIEEHD
ncbi:MAG: hypothetical protein GY737_30100, partial [Desulfobacteraceae bacterium]|nr:hypothetical protein [Desulfobacteraceae bacterium]